MRTASSSRAGVRPASRAHARNEPNLAPTSRRKSSIVRASTRLGPCAAHALSAVVFRTAPSGERAVLAVVRAPDVLGEVALLDRSPRSASIESLEDITALALSGQSFLDLAYRNPKVLDTVLKIGRAHV